MAAKLTPVRSISQDRVRAELETGKAETTKEAEANKVDPAFDLPKWDGKTELVAGFERLAELYARMGKTEQVNPSLSCSFLPR